MKAVIHLSPDEVKAVLLTHLQTKFKDARDVRLEVGKVSTGQGPNEMTYDAFKGASCEVEIE